MYKGNIVLWNDSLWIVQSVEKDIMNLIDWENSNCSAHPSKRWPENPEHRMNSVKYVARSGADYVKYLFRKAEKEMIDSLKDKL